MNLIESLYVRPPQNRVHGTIVRGPYFSGDETKPTGRPPDSGRRARILEVLDDGPATLKELTALTGIKTDAVKHILRRLQRDGAVEVTYIIVRGTGRVASWRMPGP